MILLVFLFCLFFDASSSVAATAAASTFILRLFRTYLALYLVQSDTKKHTPTHFCYNLTHFYGASSCHPVVCLYRLMTQMLFITVNETNPVSLSFIKYDS